MNTFEFPKTTGKLYADKTKSAQVALAKYATHKANLKLGESIK